MAMVSPVYQTILRPPQGNCYPAALASLFGVRLIDVPNFGAGHRGTDWYFYAQEWLRQYNITFIQFTTEGGQRGDHWAVSDSRATPLFSIPSMRFRDADNPDMLHCVVGRLGVCQWDPWPGVNRIPAGTTLNDIVAYDVYHPIDPSKPM